ncbi:MAG: hypothetical protein PHW50_00180 [Patescibacteria group bacterium]|nr:hypothetical protein [Patescibacteria group bacterium]
MIYLFSIYFLFLIVWFIISYFVAKQLMMYGFVGDATKTMTKFYFFISGIIIVISLIVLIII